MVEDQEDAINNCWVRYFAATDPTVLTDAEGLEYIHDYEERGPVDEHETQGPASES